MSGRTRRRIGYFSSSASSFLAQSRQSEWTNLASDLRSAELAVKRYDTQKLKHILLRLVPELAKTSISTKPGAAEVVPLHRSG